LRTEIFILFPE